MKYIVGYVCVVLNLDRLIRFFFLSGLYEARRMLSSEQSRIEEIQII